MKSVFECSVPTTFIILPYEIKKDNETVEKGNINIESNLNKVDSWFSKLTSVINVVDNNVAKVRTNAASQIEGMFKDLKSDKLYLYLVDEVTGEPVVGGSHPIVISMASEKAKKFVPLMSVRLKTLCLTDKVGGLARCFGRPAPKFMNKETRGLAEKLVGSIN
ncbi:hypothetical protein TL16_g06376 [Triparma laevis f. inornata]|uniref:Uncharacterized protein n=1 Tax=Triparma laevis f. inornata TaxID=1714386 RepID=A0A9W7AJM8_9STRA|nr:hypothetical protein TL16_g06376 [Triparma laevis f. inornata]